MADGVTPAGKAEHVETRSAVQARDGGDRSDAEITAAQAVGGARAGAVMAPAALRALQQTVGNRAVAAAVASRSAVNRTLVVARDINAAQLAAARSYYRRYAARFTPEVITRVQGVVRVAPTGAIDDRTITAIAIWQAAHPPLVADGIAAERTLAIMLPSGLAATGAMTAMNDAVAQLGRDWPSLTPDQRAARMLAAANERLTSTGVPACRPATESGSRVAAGTFNHVTWAIWMHPAYSSLDAPTADQLDQWSRTIFHEARHAEQNFLVARYLAADHDAERLVQALQIPADIAAAAAANPLPPRSPEAIIAAGWHRSMYGGAMPGIIRRRNAADAAYERALDADSANSTPATRQAVVRAEAARDRAEAAYRNQAHEFDSFEVERRLHAAHS